MFKFILFLIITPFVACHHHHDHHDHGHSNHSNAERSHNQHRGHHGSPVELTFFNVTKIQAPYHCHQNGWKVNEIPLSNLITHGTLIDVSEKTKSNPDFQLLPEHLEEWEKTNGKFRNNTVLIINFGWASKFGNPEYYGSSKPSFPGISEKAAEYIVNSNAVVGVGVDTPKVDSGNAADEPALHSFHGSNIFTVDKLALNKEQLHKHFYIVIVPLEYNQNAEALVRVIAV
ncbi:uncharacterized protein LOC135835493 [Planococcus citri]|uniref:uncharacterized protein LOC135835493 n=1 Tax=Planococcus citri TaxID=170843 RepID=UPI0031F8E5BF